MARITYADQTAAAFKAVREVPRDGLSEWREAIRRHLRRSEGMTLVDIGARTSAFAAAFSDWFALSVLAVEPSAAMRDQIPRTPAIKVLEGNATSIPLPDESADAAWLSLVIHHIPDLAVAAHADFLGQVGSFRRADTTMRNLTEDEFLRGKERLRLP
jgi:hypothetical protein